MEGTGLLAGMRPRSADGGPLRRGSVAVCRLRVWGSRLVLPGFEERPRLATPPGGYSCWKHALRPSPPLPAHPRRLSGYSVARNDLHRAGGGNSDRTPVTSTRAATGERRRGEVSTEVAEPIVYIIHRGDSRRCSGQWSRLFPTARTAVGTDGSPEHVLDQYRDAFEVAIGTGLLGSARHNQ